MKLSYRTLASGVEISKIRECDKGYEESIEMARETINFGHTAK
jgi:hypothetical protein